MNLIYCRVLYNGNTSEYVGNKNQIATINCVQLEALSPRPVWLIREGMPGDGTIQNVSLNFNPSSDDLTDQNTIRGFFISVDGKQLVVDVLTEQAFRDACNAAPGSVPAIVASFYNGNPPVFAPLALNTYCISTLDDGSAAAAENLALRYVDNIYGDIRIGSHVSGVSRYTVKSYWTLAALRKQMQGADTVVAGTCS
jgi:hypothetical protein